MADLTFVTSVSGVAGKPLHVSVYENGAAVSDVTFSNTSATMTITPDPAGGFNIVDTAAETVSITATRAADGAVGVLSVAVSAPPVLQFTSP